MAEVEIAIIHFDTERNEFVAKIPHVHFISNEELDGFVSVEYDTTSNFWVVRFTTLQSLHMEELLLGCNCTVRKEFQGSYESISPVLENSSTSNKPPSSPLLTPYEEAMRLADQGVSYCISGPGGTGKSHLIWQIFEHLTIVKRKVVGITALTGKAAVELRAKMSVSLAEKFDDSPVVTTVMSFLGLTPHHLDEIMYRKDLDYYAKLLAQTFAKSESIMNNWTKTDTLMVDEVSMLQPRLLTFIVLLMRLLRKTPLQFIFVGDFYQLPPVIKELNATSSKHFNNKNTYITNEEARQEEEYCFQVYFWKELVENRVIILNTNYRVTAGRKTWIDLLGRIRVGRPELNDFVLLCQMNSTIRKITNNHLNLCATNEDVFVENTRRNAELKANPCRTYKFCVTKVIQQLSQTAPKITVTDRYETIPEVKRFVEKLAVDTPSIELYIGSRVMLIENICIPERLVNGSQGVVTELHDDHVVVNFDNLGNRDIIQRPYTFVEDIYTVQYKSLPLVLAFAITIHKSQSMTLPYIYCNFAKEKMGKMRRTVYQKGQIYTALSRGQDPDSMIMDGFNVEDVQKFITPIPLVDAFYAEAQNYVFRAEPERSKIGQPKNYDPTNKNHNKPKHRVSLEVMLLRQKRLGILKAEYSKFEHERIHQEIAKRFERYERAREQLIRESQRTDVTGF